MSVPSSLWTRIVFAAKESEDWKLRTLIEQAVAEAQIDVLSIPSPSAETLIHVQFEGDSW